MLKGYVATMTSPTPAPARRERAALCDLFAEVGPDAPTLSGDWTTRDLAAHLVIRERRPDAAVGIVVSKLAGHTAKVQAGVAAQPWPDLVEQVRSGPPRLSPMRLDALDRAMNTIEFFVHHEDVRRAGERWTIRELDADLRDDLRTALGRLGKRLVSSLPIGLTLAPTDTTDTEPIVLRAGQPVVTVGGPIGEIVLFVYGRQVHSQVDLVGELDDIETVRHASFGV